MNSTSIVRAATIFAIAAMSVIAFAEARAQEPNAVQSRPVQAVMGSAEQITMTMGKGGLFQTSAPFAKISVGDDKIVDVAPQSDREFVFTPKAIGSTNVFVFSDKNKLIARLDVNVEPATAQEAREETGKVRIYNDKKSLAKPARYRCNRTDCDLEGEAAIAAPGPNEATAATANAGAKPEAVGQ